MDFTQPEDPVNKHRHYVTRLAHEGVPVRAIARVFEIAFADIYEALQEALAVGQIIEIPKVDWPPLQDRGSRRQMFGGEIPLPDMLLAFQRILHLTPLEANFLALLLRRDEVDKDTLHGVVEQQREQRQHRPDKPEPTDKKIVDVIICKLRKKLPTGVEIVTLWGRGYYIDEAGRRRAKEIINGQESPATPVPGPGFTSISPGNDPAANSNS